MWPTALVMTADPPPAPSACQVLPLSSLAHSPCPSTPAITRFEQGCAATYERPVQPAAIPARLPVALIHWEAGAGAAGAPAHAIGPTGVVPPSRDPAAPPAPPPPAVPAPAPASAPPEPAAAPASLPPCPMAWTSPASAAPGPSVACVPAPEQPPAAAHSMTTRGHRTAAPPPIRRARPAAVPSRTKRRRTAYRARPWRSSA